ncbi:MAG: PAS domain S-box protein [Chloroflexi bacterium]|nr:PAS domain S-box protein [Chloroflexota bacterium]
MRGMSLALKLPLVIVMAIILTGLVGGLTGYFIGRNMLRDQTIAANINNVQTYASAVRLYLEGARSQLEMIADMPQMSVPLSDTLIDPSLHGVPADAVVTKREIAADLLRHSAIVRHISLLRANGDVYLMEPYEEQLKLSHTNLAYNAWYQELMSTGKTVISDLVICPADQEPTVVIAVPVRGTDGRIAGVLAGHLALEQISQVGVSAWKDETPLSWGYITDGRGLIIADTAHPLYVKEQTDFSSLPPVSLALAGKEGALEYFNSIERDERLGAYMQLPDTGWAVVYVTPTKTAFAPINQMAQNMALTIVVAIFLLGIVGVVLARQTTVPLDRLTRAVEAFGAGDLTQRIKMKTGDEIGQLAAEFNRMAASLADKEAQLRQYATELEQKVEERTQELRESEERFRVAAASASDLIWDWDIPSGRLEWYGRIDEILGYETGEFPRILDAWEKAIHPDDVDRVNATLDGHLKKGTPYNEEYRIMRKDGAYLYWTDQGMALRDDNGQPYKMIGACSDITERKWTEEALLESEEKYRDLVEDLPDVVFAVDQNGALTYLSPAVESMTGYSASELMGRTFAEFLHPEDLAHAFDTFQRTLSGQAMVDELRFFTKSGEMRWLRNSNKPIFVEDRVIGVHGVFSDVTERKRMEEALIQSQRELAIRHQIANVFLAVPDDEMYGEVLQIVLQVMESKYGVFGYIREDGALVAPSMTRGIWDQCQVPQKDFVFPRETWGDSSWPRAIREKKTNYTNERSTRTPEGHIPITRYISMPVIYQGEAIGLIQIANKTTDYSEEDVQFLETLGNQIGPILGARLERDRQERARKKAEEERTSVLAERAAIVDAMGDGLIALDMTGGITAVNPPFQAMTGYSESELVRGNAADLLLKMIKPEDLEEMAAVFATAMEGKTTPPSTFSIIKKDGSNVPVASAMSFVKNAEGNPATIIATFKDITEIMRKEEDLRKAMTELERSNTELERFAYVASHDLQEPLRMVSSYTQLLEKRYKDKLDDDAHEFIGYAVDGAKRMQNLINDLLAYSRVGTRGKPLEPTDCEAVFDAAIANLSVVIKENKAKVSHDPLPTVIADEGQLVQLFQNLIGNAIKFHGKRLPRVHVSAKTNVDKWVFSIKDNGIGIDPQYFDRIFIIFQRLHGEGYTGTGTGLAIAKRIVERHGGRIWIESEPDKGSTFYFTLQAKGERSVARDSGLVARSS